MYAMTDGRCIYQGSSENLIMFLSECGLPCPESYNPCDFLTEIANGEYGAKNDDLCKRIRNGKEENYRAEPNSTEICESSMVKKPKSRKFSSNFFRQLWFLMIRNSLITYRDMSNMWLRLGLHTLCSLFVSLVFANVGNDGAKAISNVKLIYGFTTFVLYTNYYSMATRFPLEKSVIKREHFNKWYSAEAYYIALTVTDIPITIACLCIAVFLAWDITGQPWEFFRFQLLMASQTLMSFTSQGLGLMVGSCFNLQVSFNEFWGCSQEGSLRFVRRFIQFSSKSVRSLL
jgi:ATP-binding cassette, subfamily G (WHITE), member 1